ncbi:MAG: serine hydrolase domain-containing protein [Candidatus Hermodarchaeota archaeon]
MDEYLHSKNFSGTILVKRNNKTVCSKAMGYANLSHKVPNNMDTLYGLASIGKLFTAMSSLLVLRDKKMTTKDKIYQFLETIDIDFEIPGDITFHHLLTHTSGIQRYYTIDPYFVPQNSLEQDRWKSFWKKHPNYLLQSPFDYVPFLNDVDFAHPVGKTFYYTNTSYILLGILIQVLGGQSYYNFVRNKILNPLNLERTRFLKFDEIYENVAEGYTPVYHQGSIKRWEKNIYRLPIIGSADGGIFSNVYDLDKLITELRNKKGIFSDILTDLIYPHVLMEKIDAYQYYYGYGITLMYQNEEMIRYGLAGGDFGVAAGVYYYPKEQLSVIILSNHNTSDDNWMFSKEFHDLFLDL